MIVVLTGAELILQKILIAGNYCGRISHGANNPFFKPQRTRAQCLDLVYRVRTEQDGCALFLQSHDTVKRLARKGSVTYGKCFVYYQNVGIDAGGYGEGQEQYESQP